MHSLVPFIVPSTILSSSPRHVSRELTTKEFFTQHGWRSRLRMGPTPYVLSPRDTSIRTLFEFYFFHVIDDVHFIIARYFKNMPWRKSYI
jgi:hypothetical protein